MVKNSPAHAGDARAVGSIPGWRKSPWKRKWQLTSLFLSGKSHGQRNLAGYSLWGHKESDMTEQLSTAQHAIKQRVSKRSILFSSL